MQTIDGLAHIEDGDPVESKLHQVGKSARLTINNLIDSPKFLPMEWFDFISDAGHLKLRHTGGEHMFLNAIEAPRYFCFQVEVG